MRAKGTTQGFAVTLTLLPKLFKDPAEKQYDLTAPLVCDFLRQFGEYTVVAELTKASNIHYHALVFMNCNETMARKRINDAKRTSKYFGFGVIKLCTDEPGWLDYMSKDVETFKENILRPPILHDERHLMPSQFGVFFVADH